MQYSPGMEFCPFDVFVFTGPLQSESGGGGDTKRTGATSGDGFFLGYDELHRTLATAGFAIYTEAIAAGPLSELLKLEVSTMVSTIPARLGLPPLQDVGIPNLSEGVVLRPRCAGMVGISHPRAMLKLTALCGSYAVFSTRISL